MVLGPPRTVACGSGRFTVPPASLTDPTRRSHRKGSEREASRAIDPASSGSNRKRFNRAGPQQRPNDSGKAEAGGLQGTRQAGGEGNQASRHQRARKALREPI